MPRIAVLAGDGIGPEIVNEALRVLEVVKTRHNLDLTWE
ncbi:MAG: isocitrate/isopropylmalate family dehydrogenase, partial [Armatimonadetes bacterium]|nr:isocitrate/isopropylmalate family dehydrogenase [Armatimonadota bacterium]